MWGRIYTPEEARIVREMVDDGYSLSDIASEICRSKNSVYGFVRRNKMRTSPSPSNLDGVGQSQVIELLAKGHTVPEVASIRGRKEQSVREMIFRLEKRGLIVKAGTTKGVKGRWALIYKPTRAWRHDIENDN